MVELPNLWRPGTLEELDFNVEKFCRWINDGFHLVPHTDAALRNRYLHETIPEVLAHEELPYHAYCEYIAGLAVAAFGQAGFSVRMLSMAVPRTDRFELHAAAEITLQQQPYLLELDNARQVHLTPVSPLFHAQEDCCGRVDLDTERTLWEQLTELPDRRVETLLEDRIRFLHCYQQTHDFPPAQPIEAYRGL